MKLESHEWDMQLYYTIQITMPGEIFFIIRTFDNISRANSSQFNIN